MVGAPGSQDLCNLGKDGSGVRNKVERIGVIHKIEGIPVQAGQVAHVALDRYNGDAVMHRRLSIPLQLLW
jgi:hypothetical protein